MKLLLFGAGASIPFFETPLTTDYITKEVQSSDRWRRVIAYCNMEYKQEIDVDYVLELIKKLSRSEEYINFEHICNGLDNIALLLAGYSDSNTIYRELIALKDTGFIELIRGNKKKVWFYPYLFRCLIAEIIVSSKRQNNYDDLTALQGTFLESLGSKDDEISIISLNYDDVLQDSMKSYFFDGYTFYGYPYFDIKSFYEKKKTISYLHGGIRFFYSNFGIIRNRRQMPSIQERVENIFVKYNLMDLDYYSFNTFITTGQNKDLALNYSPFKYYYAKFSRDLCRSNVLIIAGYSFRDEHINRIISPFIHINSNNRIIIVDNNPHIITKDDFNNRYTILSQVKKVFDPEDCVSNPNISTINEKGYGYLFSQIIYYKNGYKKFLSRYEDVFKYAKI